MNAKIFRSLEEAAGQFGPCALSIGNFDGVHLGHQALLRETIRLANAHQFVPSILTFDPHPTTIVAPERTPPLICTLEEKLRLFDSLGIQHILVLPFTPDIGRLTPREFVWQILVKSLNTRAVVVGENFRFGHKQSGNPDTLRALGDEFEFVSKFLPPVSYRGETVSSSAIRRYLSEGFVSQANRLLGRCFSVEGPVVSGQGIGSKQTVPTLNLRPVPGQLVPRGVYITETSEVRSGRRWPSITNVGNRPTFGGDELTIETFLLSPIEGTSPVQIQVKFRKFVRHERQFPDAAALQSQIFKDVGRAQAYWRRVNRLR